ncbi:MAG: pyridoxal phosphate-dependent aminotransferase [Alcaligenaceae bacterium]|nr:pyridoxal phosphate-dependent aminotransferase [Alcaligenaceae bacterium]
MIRIANRIQDALTFQAMEVTKTAQKLKEQGKDIISLGIGEPDFTAPPIVVETLSHAAEAGLSGYSPALGIAPLRTAIADYYKNAFGASVNPEQVIITSGASGALSLACLSVLNPGDEILMPDPAYPANSNFIICAGAKPRLIPCFKEERFQLSAEKIIANWGSNTRGVLIASPSNPTGTSVDIEELRKIFKVVKERNGLIIMDEIYLGLSYDLKPVSALTLDPDIIVINSFSKYFNMTGWRLGWMIVPANVVPAVEKLASSLAICPSTLAQHAAITCFTDEAMAIYEKRRLAFKERRDYLIPELERLKLTVPVVPDGAFYIYADISHYADDSETFARDLLNEAGVVVIPGLDFGPEHARRMIRISYATGLDRLKEAIARMESFLNRQ